MTMIEKYITLNDKQICDFETLYTLLENSVVNVTAIKGRQDYYIKHVLDSLWFFRERPPRGTVADIGAGGGFPGLVLALYYPELQVTLVDSVGKKCRFMESAAKELKLTNVSIINARAEAVKGQYDLITARGVGTVREVLKWTRHLSHAKTAWLMYKGERLAAELEEALPHPEMRGLQSETERVETPFTRTYLYLTH